MLNAVDFSEKGNIEALEAIFSVSPKSSKYFKFDEYTGVLQESTTYLSRDFGSDLVKSLQGWSIKKKGYGKFVKLEMSLFPKD